MLLYHTITISKCVIKILFASLDKFFIAQSVNGNYKQKTILYARLMLSIDHHNNNLATFTTLSSVTELF